MEAEFRPDVVEGETCPMCHKNTLTLTETDREVPFFGMVYVFSMTCSSCKYHKADLETKEKKEPCKWTLEVESEEDLKSRVVKSAEATVKIPRIITIESGPAANGYISNVEGILKRIIRAIESARDAEEDAAKKKTAKNHLKKLNKVLWGQEKLKVIIEDKTGNSAIVSEKAVRTKL
ncbi:MAG: ZPR1 zinc finger domain-containing protein [Candidatus Nanoarchaeia archaeon]